MWDKERWLGWDRQILPSIEFVKHVYIQYPINQVRCFEIIRKPSPLQRWLMSGFAHQFARFPQLFIIRSQHEPCRMALHSQSVLESVRNKSGAAPPGYSGSIYVLSVTTSFMNVSLDTYGYSVQCVNKSISERKISKVYVKHSTTGPD